MLVRKLFLVIVIVYSIVSHIESFLIRRYTTRTASPSLFRVFFSQSSNRNDLEATRKALLDARNNERMRLSPGAGLATAEEQAEAAYADLINTTMDQRGIDGLSEEELSDLAKGGTMWEKEAKNDNGRVFGIFSDLFSVFKALSGGAHIEKNEYGET